MTTITDGTIEGSEVHVHGGSGKEFQFPELCKAISYMLVGAQIVLQYGVWTLHSDTALTCGIVALCLMTTGLFCFDNCFIRPVTEANTGFQAQIFRDWNSRRTDRNRKTWKYCSTLAVALGCAAVAWASAGCPSSDEGFAIGSPAFPGAAFPHCLQPGPLMSGSV